MTAIDLAMVLFAIITVRYAQVGGFFRRRSRGRVLIILGVSTYAAFYLADLLIMYAGPSLVGAPQTARLMEMLHLNVLWLVALIGVGCTAIGFLATSRSQARDEERLRLMTDALPVAIAFVDDHERYQFANRRYASVHGKVPEDIIGKRVTEVVRPDLYENFRERTLRTLRGESVSHEYRTRLDQDGELHDLHVDLLPEVAADGHVAGYFVLLLDVTNRVQLERDVIRAAESERLSVARDLHDGLGQALTGISLALRALARKLDQEGSKQVSTVANLTATAQKTIEQARQYTRLLAPTLQGGLFSALQTLASEVSTLYDIECSMQCPTEDVPIAPAVAMHLYRIAQESVNNAARHGRASTIEIDCRIENHALVLEISDDGLGIPATSERREGMGLKSMYYRARMIGGTLRVNALEDGGTEVCCVTSLPALVGDLPEREQAVEA
jgi:PAS domain S-box-containing protein